jgi:excisionase family DNA binding protein
MEIALTMTEAAQRLGITRATLGRLVREGTLPVVVNPLDKRQRLIPESVIRELEARRSRPRPRTAGELFDPEVSSSQVDEYLMARWRPA